MSKEKYSPKERLIKVINGEIVDRPPCICPGGMMNMIVEDIMDISGMTWPEAHENPQKMAELTKSMYFNGGFENFGVPFCMTVEAESMGAKVSYGTKLTEPRIEEYPVLKLDDWRTLSDISLSEGRVKVVLDAIKILKSGDYGVPLIGNIVGPVSLASSLLEPMEFYKAMRRKPQELHEFMEFVTDNIIKFAREEIKAGADIIAISDPSGTGEILGPKLFNEYTVTYINKIIRAIKDEVPGGVIVHICGRLGSVYKELNAIESPVLSFDSITPVKEVATNVKNKVLMGNVSTLALDDGKQDILRKIAGSCINNGISILSPACGIGTKTSIDSIRTIVDVASHYAVEE